jgi:glycosyltransferase involved in cell wall biosynthesis
MCPREIARNGGELRYWQNLASLVTLGHEVHLILCCTEDNLEPHVRRLAASVHVIPASFTAIARAESWFSLLSDELALLLNLPAIRGKHEEVSAIVAEINPDLVWADWIGSVALAPEGVPLVYSHHDFFYRVKSIRDRVKSRRLRWPDQVRRERLKRIEHRLCEKAEHIVCVSFSEKESLAAHTLDATYIPIVGPYIPPSNTDLAAKGRVFLFGNGGNTALRFTLAHIQRDLWPLFERNPIDLEWHQVGHVRDEDRQLIEGWRWVEKHCIAHGFVVDLSEVFQLGDVSLMPYTEDTGFRTKFVTASGYGVINVGYNDTFRCAPEFTPGENCLVAQSATHLIALLGDYASDKALRRRLGEASRELYEKCFTFEAQLPLYQRALSQIGFRASLEPHASA